LLLHRNGPDAHYIRAQRGIQRQHPTFLFQWHDALGNGGSIKHKPVLANDLCPPFRSLLMGVPKTWFLAAAIRCRENRMAVRVVVPPALRLSAGLHTRDIVV
jgi:hypothetical protein